MPVSKSNPRDYAKVIGRISQFLSLVSLCPVVLRLRFSLRGTRIDSHAKKRQAAKSGGKDQEDGAKAPTDDPASLSLWPDMPLGLLSALLMAASEAIQCRGLFEKQVFHGKNKGLIGHIMKGVTDASKKLKPGMGFMDRAGLLVIEVLESDDAFLGVHGIVILVNLGTIAVSILFRVVGTIHSSPGGYRRALTAISKTLVMLILIPAILAPVLREEALKTALKALMSENFLISLRVPLRVLALVLATPVREGPTDQDTGTPVFFMALQGASLATSLSALVSNVDLGRTFAAFVKEPRFSTLWNTPELLSLAPVALGLLWAGLNALRQGLNCLLLTTALSVAFAPGFLSSSWPKLVGWKELSGNKGTSYIGDLGRKGSGGPAGLLSNLLSLLYAFVSGIIFFSGGTVSLLVVMVVVQGIVYWHGEDLMKVLQPIT